MSVPICRKCGHPEHGVGCPALNLHAPCHCAYMQVAAEPVHGPITRTMLHARIADVLRRSGVEDAERLIRAMEQDAAEVDGCIQIGRLYMRSLRNLTPFAADGEWIAGRKLDADADRIDRALAGNQIGPVSDPPDRMTP